MSDFGYSLKVSSLKRQKLDDTNRFMRKNWKMGPLHRLASLFNNSAIDVNENLMKRGKLKFPSEMDIFVKESESIKTKAYVWTSVRLPKKKKDSAGKGAIKGGRTSPNVRPPQPNRITCSPPPKSVEALAVLVQHLVFNLEAFQVPVLKKQLEKSRSLLEDEQRKCADLERDLAKQISDQSSIIEEQEKKLELEIVKLTQDHQTSLDELNQQHNQYQNRIRASHELVQTQLEDSERRFADVQKQREQDLEILKEENEAIREEMDEQKNLARKLEVHCKNETERLRKEFENKEIRYKEQLEIAAEEITRLKQENNRLIGSMSEGKEGRVQSVLAEVESLRAVLELKQNEAAELRRNLAEANQKAELLPSAQEKVSTLSARCEDLESQLERKHQYENQLMQDNRKLHESFKEEVNMNKRLSQHNEELQWKLKQNKEVVSRVLEQAEESGAFNRSILNASFNEKHGNIRANLERALSFRETSSRARKSKNSSDLDIDDGSPPSSPKVKGVVEKSDSVSYVLEMEESPEMIANRIVRRSFRNGTPPKNTPTRCLNNKRPRIKGSNPLSLSASTSAIIPMINKSDHLRSRSVSIRNGDRSGSTISDEVFIWSSTPQGHFSDIFTDDSYKSAKSDDLDRNNIFVDFDDDDLDDLKLPALPKEGENAEPLPIPKRLAGESMVSESTSEDDSTSSSSEQL